MTPEHSHSQQLGTLIFRSAVYWLGPAARYSIFHFPWIWDDKESWISWN